jgi:redox-sensitive bicupin YhaK (pirin superfamily)
MAAGLDAAIELVISGRPRPVGNVTVARLIPVAQRRHLGPFVFLDHMGPVAFPAGTGFDVAQLWLGLPLAHEQGEPLFAHHIFESSGLRARILFGAAFGKTSPALHPANPLLAEVRFDPGATLEHPALTPEDERGIFLIEGELQLGETVLQPNQLLVFKPSVPVKLQANQRSRALLLGGPRLDGAERFIDWNFVCSSKEAIAQAKADWIARKFPLVPGDEEEFIPLHQNH